MPSSMELLCFKTSSSLALGRRLWMRQRLDRLLRSSGFEYLREPNLCRTSRSSKLRLDAGDDSPRRRCESRRGQAAFHEQKEASKSSEWRISPYNSRSVGTAFRRTCRALGSDRLFRDLRHEGSSRLFDRASGVGHRPSRLEDASSIYRSQARVVA